LAINKTLDLVLGPTVVDVDDGDHVPLFWGIEKKNIRLSSNHQISILRERGP
jgi:hypothetical protein